MVTHWSDSRVSSVGRAFASERVIVFNKRMRDEEENGVMWMHKPAHCAIETMSRVEARERRKRKSPDRVSMRIERLNSITAAECEDSLESFVRENRENEIAHERNLILCRARVTFISACRSREYRRRRINSPVEAAVLCATIDRDDKFALSRGKRHVRRTEKNLLRVKKEIELLGK